MKKATQRPLRLLFKCHTCDEEEDPNRAYTRSYDLIAHLVNKHRLFPMSIRHNVPYQAVKSDLRLATAEEMIKYRDVSNHRRKNTDERPLAGEASASCTTVELEAPSETGRRNKVKKSKGKRPPSDNRREGHEARNRSGHSTDARKGEICADTRKKKKRVGALKDSSREINSRREE